VVSVSSDSSVRSVERVEAEAVQDAADGIDRRRLGARLLIGLERAEQTDALARNQEHLSGDRTRVIEAERGDHARDVLRLLQRVEQLLGSRRGGATRVTMRVSVEDGLTALTVMPKGARSRAATLVSANTAPLPAA